MHQMYWIWWSFVLLLFFSIICGKKNMNFNGCIIFWFYLIRISDYKDFHFSHLCKKLKVIRAEILKGVLEVHPYDQVLYAVVL